MLWVAWYSTFPTVTRLVQVVMHNVWVPTIFVEFQIN